jgi:hypothetical protein
MKKLLSIAAVAALFATGMNAADDQIDITGTVLSGAVVGFVEMSGEALFSGDVGIVKFKDPGQINLGIIGVGETFADNLSQDIYVKTNDTNGVSMTITDTVNNGHLTGIDNAGADNGEDINMAYTLMGTDYTVGTTGAVTVASGKDDGTTDQGDFVMAPVAAKANQAAGTYGTVLTVAIAVL